MPPGAPGRLRHRQHLAKHGLLFHRHVAILVGGRTAQKCDVDRHRLEEQPFLPGEGDDFYEIQWRTGTLPGALLSWIDETVESRLGEQAGSAGGHIAHELRQHTLRKRVRFDLVLGCQANEARRIDESARDRPLEQTLVREMTGTQSRPIADADNAHRCKSSRLAFRLEAPLDRGKQSFGHRMTAAGTADQDRVAIFN